MDTTKAREYFENKIAYTLGPMELDSLLKDAPKQLVVVDVRAAEDFDKGHVPGSINLPKDQWSTLNGLDRDNTNVVLCYSHVCHLAAKACATFAAQGFPVMEMEGGMKAWRDHNLGVEQGRGNGRVGASKADDIQAAQQGFSPPY
jgi:rhodanese-related sulfurtransferase